MVSSLTYACPGLPAGRMVPGRSMWAIHGHIADRFWVVAAVRRTACCHQRRPVLLAEGMLDLLAHHVLLAVEAVGIDGVQDADAGPGAGGDLGGRAGGVEP